jgi:hypothetical protein
MTSKLKILEREYAQKQNELNRFLTQRKKDEKRLQIIIGKAMLDKLERLEGSESYDYHKDYITTVLDDVITSSMQREFLVKQGFCGHKD